MPRLSFSAEEISHIAAENGFPLAAVVAAQSAPGFARFREWLDRGYDAGMSWLRERESAYRHPDGVLAGTQTVIMLGMPYEPAEKIRKQADAPTMNPGFGRVAAYASGSVDYHDLIHARLKRIIAKLQVKQPAIRARGVVDTAPLLERDFAALAGLGWIGKNTLLLHRRHGSYFFLAAVLVDHGMESKAMPNPATDHCGTCTACLDACPTKAFPEPRVLDANRCVAYLTIEHRGTIPIELREGIGSMIFGCDICQQVCPWNRMAQATQEDALKPLSEHRDVDLVELMKLDEADFRMRFRKTPMWRAKREGMIRNAMIAAGNQRLEAAIESLARFLTDENPTLRSTAVWALSKIGSESARQALLAAKATEPTD